MARVRTIAAVFGLAGLLGLGWMAVTRADPPESKAGPEKSPRERLRERIVTLRGEVAVLELERDATRAGLLKVMEGIEQGDAMGVDVTALLGTAKLELAGITGDAAALREMSELMTRLQDFDEKKMAESLGALKKAFGQQKTDFRANVARKKQEFARQARLLAEKRLDLEDAERRYRESR